MSNTVEKNFLGFVKAVIGATGLIAMGTAVAGVLVKGFKEGAKANQDAVAGQDNESQAKTKTDNPSDKEAETTNGEKKAN